MVAALRIAPSGLDDVPHAIALAQEAATWLTAKGEPLWGPNELKAETFTNAAATGALIMGRIGDAVATCMFLQVTDPDFWPGDPPGEALYVHRLAVSRRYAGRGLALTMLEWAAQQAKSEGCRFLRLDCEARPKLLSRYAAGRFFPR